MCDILSLLKKICGECSTKPYLEHTAHEFCVDGIDCVIVEPNKPVEGKKWVWKTMFFEAFPEFDKAMLDKGWWIGFMDVGNSFGCPDAMKKFDKFYDAMILEYGFDSKPVLEGLSRGGLYAYNWAKNNTDKVGMLYADNPVCDFKSWPGGAPKGGGKGPGGEQDWQEMLESYHFSSDEEALSYKDNPLDTVKPLVDAKVPLVHIYGDADEVVPWDENTGEMVKRVEALGGSIKTINKPGCLHHPHGPEDPEEFASWVIDNSI